MNEKPLKDVSILLVEDNEMNTLLASSIIERTGASITEVDNGTHAIEVLQKKQFDIVLMDLHMPGMNGFETTSFLRRKVNATIPVIGMSSGEQADYTLKCFEAGMNQFIRMNAGAVPDWMRPDFTGVDILAGDVSMASVASANAV